jgi:hypothetical protein
MIGMAGQVALTRAPRADSHAFASSTPNRSNSCITAHRPGSRHRRVERPDLLVGRDHDENPEPLADQTVGDVEQP